MKRNTIIFLFTFLFLSFFSCAYATNNFIDNPDSIENASDSVVLLTCYDKTGNLISSGSGFIAFDSKTIITNLHVISSNTHEVYAQTEDNKSHKVYKYLAYDIENDIVILKSDDDIADPLEFSYDEMQKGSKALAIGSPLGLMNTCSVGVYSDLINQNGTEYILFTAAISSGSSGGALFNQDGKVVGMTSASYIDGQNLNLAIPSKKINDLWNTNKLSVYKYLKDLKLDTYIIGGIEQPHITTTDIINYIDELFALSSVNPDEEDVSGTIKYVKQEYVDYEEYDTILSYTQEKYYQEGIKYYRESDYIAATKYFLCIPVYQNAKTYLCLIKVKTDQQKDVTSTLEALRKSIDLGIPFSENELNINYKYPDVINTISKHIDVEDAEEVLEEYYSSHFQGRRLYLPLPWL